MELLQFQQPQQSHPQQQCHYQAPTTKANDKPRGRGKCSGRFVGVRQRPSGRWVAEIKDTTKKIRMWLGTFETAEEAARAYDEAACLLRGSNTRTNFAAHPSPDSPLASRIRTLVNHKKLRKNASQPTVAFGPAAYRRAGTATTAAATSTSSSTITATAGDVSASSSASPSISFAMGSSGTHIPSLSNQRMAEEVYRPYPIGGSEEFHLASQQFDQSWAINASLPLTGGCDMASSNACAVLAELDETEMEKQEDSASPRGMDGVQDKDSIAMGNDPCDSLWDLPPICQLSCRSLMY